MGISREQDVNGGSTDSVASKKLLLWLLITVTCAILTLPCLNLVGWLYLGHLKTQHEKLIADGYQWAVTNIDWCLEGYFLEHQRYPNELADLWKDLPDDDGTAEKLTIIDGNPIQYRYPSQHGQSRPDVWLIDKTTGKVLYSNWSK